jgi:RHS repeat-associated protein
VVTTVAIPAAQASSTACTTITGWSDYTEYGTPRDGEGTAAVAGSIGYGWLGAKQRSTTPETAGLTLMGDRLYNSATGRFTSLDPEPGGSANPYAYPTDPINQYDLNGHWWGWHNVGRWIWHHKVDIALTVATFVLPEAAGAIWAYRAYRLTRLAEAGIESARATRATSWLAGRMWVGRGGIRGVADNGARMYSRGEGALERAWRGPSRKGSYGYSSNLTKSVRGRHDYFNFHINHGRF